MNTEELVEQAEQHEAALANFKAEGDKAQNSLVNMSRILSTNRRFEQILETASSVAMEDAMVLMDDIGDDYYEDTVRDRMFGIIVSQVSISSHNSNTI